MPRLLMEYYLSSQISVLAIKVSHLRRRRLLLGSQSLEDYEVEVR